MQVARIKHTKKYTSLDSMVFAVAKSEPVLGVCSGTLFVDKSWKTLIIPTVIGVLFVLLFMVFFSTLNISHETALILRMIADLGEYLPYFQAACLLIASAILFYRGFRFKPDLMIITNSKVYLVKEVFYKKSDKTFSFEEVYKVEIKDVKIKRTIASRTIRLSLPKNYIAKLVSPLLNKPNLFNTNLKINLKQARDLLQDRIALLKA